MTEYANIAGFASAAKKLEALQLKLQTDTCGIREQMFPNAEQNV